jgi:uncharacterized protein YbjT (DUF2867 family)
VYPVFGESADVPTPMVATHDVGAAAARALTSPPAASEVVDLEAPSYTERQVAERLGALLGTALDVVTVPRSGWLDALASAGVLRRVVQTAIPSSSPAEPLPTPAGTHSA